MVAGVYSDDTGASDGRDVEHCEAGGRGGQDYLHYQE